MLKYIVFVWSSVNLLFNNLYFCCFSCANFSLVVDWLDRHTFEEEGNNKPVFGSIWNHIVCSHSTHTSKETFWTFCTLITIKDHLGSKLLD